MTREDESDRDWKTTSFVVAGLAVTPIAVLLSMAASGGGDGRLNVFGILYPIPMMLMSAIPVVPFILVVVQLPFYGWLIGVSRQRRKTLLSLLAFHAAMAGIAVFMGL